MKNKTVFKGIILFIIAMVLFAIPAKTYAAADLGSIFGEEELEELEDPNPSPEPEPEVKPTTPENQYSEAGLVEDTMMIITIAVLGITAIYAYRKVNEYQNI